MKRKMLYLFVAVALVWLPIAAMADSITPISFTGSGPTGASYMVHKTVTIDAGTPTFSLNSFATYTSVCLATDGFNIGFVGVSFLPNCYVGAFDRSVEREFNFDVTFTDLVPGTHYFNINALVDGVTVAFEKDSITSVGGQVPEPATMFLLGSGLLGLWGARKKFKK